LPTIEVRQTYQNKLYVIQNAAVLLENLQTLNSDSNQ